MLYIQTCYVTYMLYNNIIIIALYFPSTLGFFVERGPRSAERISHNEKVSPFILLYERKPCSLLLSPWYFPRLRKDQGKKSLEKVGKLHLLFGEFNCIPFQYRLRDCHARSHVCPVSEKKSSTCLVSFLFQ